MEKLKIGITCYPTFGGSGVVATEIGMAMAERGHRVHFICYDVPRRLNRFQENIFFHEVEVHDNPLFTYPPYSLALASKMVEVTNYENLDILHVHYGIPHATSAYLAKQILGESAPKIITTLHGTDITLVGHERNYLPITRFSIIQSDGVTVPSKFLRMATYDKLNVPTEFPIEVIPNFVDLTSYRIATQKEKIDFRKSMGSCPIEGKIIVHVSNFRPVKRIADVIATFAEVRKSLNVHLLLVGDGPERSSAEAKVRELGLEKNVCFLGKQDNVAAIIRNCDLFILPSENESFGLAALEAMSSGLPVVASTTEGLPEVVINNETGLLADVGDVESLAQHVTSILSDNELYNKMSVAARKRVEDNFSKECLISTYENFYYQTLGSKEKQTDLRLSIK
ncbi:MAG: N-acetyl-alpha-D-glucosaminyl L-malate synthase BshA [Bdellovibrionales bacterium]|nr:N-acetyl-alpha-D-glucosaminyl L-malate synthase BshA [Bdellovibrionales bacterium]